jgi:hypothetical protein
MPVPVLVVVLVVVVVVLVVVVVVVASPPVPVPSLVVTVLLPPFALLLEPPSLLPPPAPPAPGSPRTPLPFAQADKRTPAHAAIVKKKPIFVTTLPPTEPTISPFVRDMATIPNEAWPKDPVQDGAVRNFEPDRPRLSTRPLRGEATSCSRAGSFSPSSAELP